MAVTSTILNTTGSAYVKAEAPYTHFGTDSTSSYLLSGRHNQNKAKYLLFRTPAWPANLGHNKIYCIRIKMQLCRNYGSMSIRSRGAFDADTVTYDSMPEDGGVGFDVPASDYDQGVWFESYRPLNVDISSATRATRAVGFLRGGGFSATVDQDEDLFPWYMKAALSNGDPVHVEVTYDDTDTVKSQVYRESSPTGTVNPLEAQTFTWAYMPKSGTGYCYDETWTQASANLYWKTSADADYHSISIPDGTMSVTVPSGTFPTGKEISFYIESTDTEGTTSSTQVVTFNTAAVRLRVMQCPAGNNVDTRRDIVFSWALETSFSDYPQASATLFWRKAGGSWNSINVSGDVHSITVPGNTFPTAASTDWYLSARATDGSAATTAMVTFSSPGSTIQALVYPSGKKVESGQPLTFVWAFRNSLGDYDQLSASLWWRASTLEQFHEIPASGGTKSLTVPKNTFPGNASTIYWYLTGTDIGGTQSQTSEQNFQTVTSKITPQNCPTSGYSDPRNAITFSWYFATETASYDQASAVFHWRLIGATAWNDVTAAGTTTSVTIAANTFPVASVIEWYVSGTDAGGCSSQSEVFSFSTEASTNYAICVSPVGRVEDGTKEITFRWIVQNSDGTSPERMFLWWKLPTESQSEWHILLNTTEQVFEFTVPPDSFPAGPVEWRVQAVNRDGVAGPENIASFVVLRAPDAPSGLSATSVPRTKVTWQSVGQEGYEVTIDGEVVESAYGPAVYSYQRTEPLEDGVHHIRVRIQGPYGLWSNYADASILVENAPAGTLELSGSFDIDADLSVSPAADEDTVIHWYRDGKRIASTIGTDRFTDRFAIGSHSYFAEIWQADGNYTRSTAVTGTMDAQRSVIAATAGGEWIEIELSESSDSVQSFNWSRTVALQHISAAPFPVLELSPYEELSGSYSCAFSSDEKSAAFESLRGKTVVLKSRRRNIVIGALAQLSKKVKHFYTAYSFSIQQIHWEDYVDATND